MNYNQYDLLVVGGGVLGTFHAYHALKKGFKVALVEKNSRPRGATVRNFGQVVPSGMNLKWQNYGRESLAIYKEIQNKFDISAKQNGTIYIASNKEEVGLLEELHSINQNNAYQSTLYTKAQCVKAYKGLRKDYCKAGLFFPLEITIEPRVMIYKLLEYMTQELGLAYYPDTLVTDVENNATDVTVTVANQKKYKANKVIICCGSEFKTLYPEIFNNSDLQVSKLQMLQTKPQKNFSLKGSILTGLSIRRYEAFSECPSYETVKKNENPESFEKKYGVHILFKQAENGSVILGDSHEYADAKNIDDLSFDSNESIDEFIIKEAKKIIKLPNYEIQNRWLGFYSQCKTQDIFQQQIGNHTNIITGIGGKGMTGSAGFSKHVINTILN